MVQIFGLQVLLFGNANIICLHCRRWVLERKLASSDVPKEEQINLIKDLERKETEFMRLKRHKICVDDFELLTIIGRGAFGEVRNLHVILAIYQMIHHSQSIYVINHNFVLLLLTHFSIIYHQSGETFVDNFSNFRFDCVGRRNLAISMPWRSWRKLKCLREDRWDEAYYLHIILTSEASVENALLCFQCASVTVMTIFPSWD